MTKARDLANASTALSAVSATELAFVDGVTSAIQTQMDAKAPSSTAVTLTGTQTLTNKTLTSPVIASVINNTLTSTTGDIIYASAANTPARLGIGSSAQVLTVASGVPSWATPAGGGGKVLQVVSTTYSTETVIASTTMTDTGISLAITPTSNTSKILVLMQVNSQIQRANVNAGGSAQVLRGATNIISWTGGDIGWQFMSAGGASNTYVRGNFSVVYLDSPATTSSTTYKLQGRSEVTSNSGQIVFQNSGSPSTITLMEIGA